ncbi:acyl-CoA dehydrogenase/oxidase [Thamnocephalis sphaerospora]|uniref:Acyl-CoA dehydrogenase/oxidase n=1 Tax=Thamnocephalis sphaerospora TaxID=78915 RepID=A0A4P9XQC4_9FUNG|nr:acyl-CoA dehydrogenase/oxidase [Thamnocephalis sphaerospora]|eukprot:RKP07691.1 acyl-CoA dehydrogenase/oxidase [Thamnocephalis sphaerospora]
MTHSDQKNSSAAERLLLLQSHLVHGDSNVATGVRDLAEERAAASFNVVDMADFFAGGKEAADYMRTAYQIIRRDPILYLSTGSPFNDTQLQEREKTMAQIRRYVEISRNMKDPKQRAAFELAMNIYSESFSMRIYVHEMLFKQSFLLNGTVEQYEEWKDDIESWKCIGCYAMTELGHSSFLRGLETTAVFDRETDEFIINSPTITSTKWWIGMAGETATHTVAICQLIIDGKQYGTFWFVVQLRDYAAGRLMPGVTAGNIGPKAGRQGLDNGWIQFNGVRIPRKNMLMRWATVTREGKFTQAPHAALSYAALIPERLSCLFATANMCGQAATIATRYSCVRRQGPKDEKVMDFQTQQVRLMPAVATVYVCSVVSRVMMAHWGNMTSMINDQPEEFLRLLSDVHAVSAGFKAVSTWRGSEVLEMCRRACGGHAYSAHNALAGIIGDWGVVTTGGGDNIVLTQQTAVSRHAACIYCAEVVF